MLTQTHTLTQVLSCNTVRSSLAVSPHSSGMAVMAHCRHRATHLPLRAVGMVVDY